MKNFRLMKQDWLISENQVVINAYEVDFKYSVIKQELEEAKAVAALFKSRRRNSVEYDEYNIRLNNVLLYCIVLHKRLDLVRMMDKSYRD